MINIMFLNDDLIFILNMVIISNMDTYIINMIFITTYYMIFTIWI